METVCQEIFRKQNGSGFEEDFGPETDVDSVDDVLLSPSIAAAKAMAPKSPVPGCVGIGPLFLRNEKLEESAGMFLKTLPWSYADAVRRPAKRRDSELSEINTSKEEEAKGEDSRDSPVEQEDSSQPSSVEDTSNDVDAESGDESEEEWNFIRGDENKENIEVDQSDSDMESRLNPNAAEFVPGAPVEAVLSSSINEDLENSMDDVAVPSQEEFLSEISQRPSELDDFGLNKSFGKVSVNGDDLAGLSTKAVFGDESSNLSNASAFFETETVSEPNVKDAAQDMIGVDTKPMGNNPFITQDDVAISPANSPAPAVDSHFDFIAMDKSEGSPDAAQQEASSGFESEGNDEIEVLPPKDDAVDFLKFEEKVEPPVVQETIQEFLTEKVEEKLDNFLIEKVGDFLSEKVGEPQKEEEVLKPTTLEPTPEEKPVSFDPLIPESLSLSQPVNSVQELYFGEGVKEQPKEEPTSESEIEAGFEIIPHATEEPVTPTQQSLVEFEKLEPQPDQEMSQSVIIEPAEKEIQIMDDYLKSPVEEEKPNLMDEVSEENKAPEQAILVPENVEVQTTTPEVIVTENVIEVEKPAEPEAPKASEPEAPKASEPEAPKASEPEVLEQAVEAIEVPKTEEPVQSPVEAQPPEIKIDAPEPEKEEPTVLAVAAAAGVGAAAVAAVGAAVSSKTAEVKKAPAPGAKKPAPGAASKAAPAKPAATKAAAPKPTAATKSAVGAKPAAAAAPAKKPAAATTLTKTTAKPTMSAAPKASSPTKVASKPSTPTTKTATTAAKPASPKPAAARPAAPAKLATTTAKPAARPLTSPTTASKPLAKAAPAPKPKAPTTTAAKPADKVVKKEEPKKAPATSTTKPAAPKAPVPKAPTTARAPAPKTTAAKPAPAKPAGTTTRTLPAKPSSPLAGKPKTPVGTTAPAPAPKKPAPIKRPTTDKTAAPAKSGTKSPPPKKPVSAKKDGEEKTEPLTQEPIVTTTNGHIDLIQNGINGDLLINQSHHEIEALN